MKLLSPRLARSCLVDDGGSERMRWVAKKSQDLGIIPWRLDHNIRYRIVANPTGISQRLQFGCVRYNKEGN